MVNQLSQVKITEGFLEGLYLVNDLSVLDLTKLGNSLSKIRNSLKYKVNKDINRLRNNNKDHPLFCPISLYRCLDMGRLEVAHTKTLAWLLNPNENHGFKRDLLISLLKLIDNNKARTLGNIKNVKSEHLGWLGKNKQGGRADIWIECQWKYNRGYKPGLIFIEAKISSPENKRQLDKYDKWIKIWNEDWRCNKNDIIRIFLTPEGREAKTGKRHWRPITYLKLAKAFSSHLSANKGKPGYHFLRFYLSGIFQDIEGWDLPITLSKGKFQDYKLFDIYSYLKSLKSS